MYSVQIIEHLDGGFNGQEQVIKTYTNDNGLIDFSVDGDRYVEDDYFVKEARRAVFVFACDDFLKDLLLQYDTNSEISISITSDLEDVEDSIIKTRISKYAIRFIKDNEVLYTGLIDNSKTKYNYFTFSVTCFDYMVVMSKVAEAYVFPQNKPLLASLVELPAMTNTCTSTNISFDNNILHPEYYAETIHIDTLRGLKNTLRSTLYNKALSFDDNAELTDFEFAISFCQYDKEGEFSRIEIASLGYARWTTESHDNTINHYRVITKSIYLDMYKDSYGYITGDTLTLTNGTSYFPPTQYANITNYLEFKGNIWIIKPYWTINGSGNWVTHMPNGYAFFGSQVFTENANEYLKTFGYDKIHSLFYTKTEQIQISYNIPPELTVSNGKIQKDVIGAVLFATDLQMYVDNYGRLQIEQIVFDEANRNYIEIPIDDLLDFNITGTEQEETEKALEVFNVFDITDNNVDIFNQFQQNTIARYKSLFSNKLPLRFTAEVGNTEEYRNINKGGILLIDGDFYFVNGVNKKDFTIIFDGWRLLND